MKLHKEFFHYVIPSMLAFALSGVYAIADGFFVGNALGDSALAAVNIAYPLTAFLQAVGTGIGMGGAIQYAISAGTENHKRGRQYFGMSLIMLTISGIFLSALLLLSAPVVLRFFGASGTIGELAQEYILYIAFGAIFQVLGTGLVPFIRNMGGAVSAMAAMIAGFNEHISRLPVRMASSLRHDGSRRCDGYWTGGNLSGVRGIFHCQKEETFAPFWTRWYLSLQNDSEGRALSLRTHIFT